MRQEACQVFKTDHNRMDWIQLPGASRENMLSSTKMIR